MAKPESEDNTVALVAGNILGGVISTTTVAHVGTGECSPTEHRLLVRGAVWLARAVVAEIQAAPANQP